MVFIARILGLTLAAAGIGVLSAGAQVKVEELFWAGIVLVAVGLLLFFLFSNLINRA